MSLRPGGGAGAFGRAGRSCMILTGVKAGVRGCLREPVHAATLAARTGVGVPLVTRFAETLVAAGLARWEGQLFVAGPGLPRVRGCRRRRGDEGRPAGGGGAAERGGHRGRDRRGAAAARGLRGICKQSIPCLFWRRNYVVLRNPYAHIGVGGRGSRATFAGCVPTAGPRGACRRIRNNCASPRHAAWEFCELHATRTRKALMEGSRIMRDRPMVARVRVRRQAFGVLPGEAVLLRPAFGSVLTREVAVAFNALSLAAAGGFATDERWLAATCLLALISLLGFSFTRRFR